MAPSAGSRECNYSNGDNQPDFQNCERQLEISCSSDPNVVNGRDEDHKSDCDNLPPGYEEAAPIQGMRGQKRERPEIREDSNHTRRNRSQGRWFYNDRPRPSGKKSRQRPVSVANIDVFSAGLWLHGAKLGIGGSPEERKNSADNPGNVDEASRPGSLHHF